MEDSMHEPDDSHYFSNIENSPDACQLLEGNIFQHYVQLLPVALPGVLGVWFSFVIFLHVAPVSLPVLFLLLALAILSSPRQLLFYEQ